MDKEKLESLRTFKRRRDDLLSEDTTTFAYNLERFLSFCESDTLVNPIIAQLKKQNTDFDVDTWLNNLSGSIVFPDDVDGEAFYQYRLLENINKDERSVLTFGTNFRVYKQNEAIEIFRSLVIRPCVIYIGDKLENKVMLASPEARDLQAVPLERIPSEKEIRIFLSHKGIDKPIVERYYKALKEIGFVPWLDNPDMPAGTALDRGIHQGFEESCAAVFFITENFVDAQFLADEIDYAKIQERHKGKKFKIITLRFNSECEIPGVLEKYIWKDVTNDLDGFYEIIRALPIELGPVRWKKEVLET